MTFQTFLLDADNRVVLVGNTIHNQEVRHMYLRVLKNEKSSRPSSATVKTTVSLSMTKVDFGKYTYGEKREQEIVLYNTGHHGVDT